MRKLAMIKVESLTRSMQMKKKMEKIKMIISIKMKDYLPEMRKCQKRRGKCQNTKNPKMTEKNVLVLGRDTAENPGHVRIQGDVIALGHEEGGQEIDLGIEIETEGTEVQAEEGIDDVVVETEKEGHERNEDKVRRARLLQNVDLPVVALLPRHISDGKVNLCNPRDITERPKPLPKVILVQMEGKTTEVDIEAEGGEVYLEKKESGTEERMSYEIKEKERGRKNEWSVKENVFEEQERGKERENNVNENKERENVKER